MAASRTTRLAPTPSGALHIGNARTFLATWALARHEGWRVLLRLEDLDIGRVKSGAREETLEDLTALGLDWDGEPLVQSADMTPYRDALTALANGGALFRCDHSRSEIRSAASAPHAEDGESRFPPDLRAPRPWPRTIVEWNANYRLVIEPAIELMHDELHGARTFNPGLEAGDLVVWTKLGVAAYQLAVVVDDARQEVTDVVRGDDLLASAARQQLIARALDLPYARWWHLPLLYGEDGKRLAKRHDSCSLRSLAAAGVARERIVGWCAWSLGLLESRAPLSPREFLARANPDALRAAVARLHSTPSVWRADDLAWLNDG